MDVEYQISTSFQHSLFYFISNIEYQTKSNIKIFRIPSLDPAFKYRISNSIQHSMFYISNIKLKPTFKLWISNIKLYPSFILKKFTLSLSLSLSLSSSLALTFSPAIILFLQLFISPTLTFRSLSLSLSLFFSRSLCRSLTHSRALTLRSRYKSFHYMFVCLFVWFDSLRPINNLSVMQGRVFQGCISTKLG